MPRLSSVSFVHSNPETSHPIAALAQLLLLTDRAWTTHSSADPPQGGSTQPPVEDVWAGRSLVIYDDLAEDAVRPATTAPPVADSTLPLHENGASAGPPSGSISEAAGTSADATTWNGFVLDPASGLYRHESSGVWYDTRSCLYMRTLEDGSTSYWHWKYVLSASRFATPFFFGGIVYRAVAHEMPSTCGVSLSLIHI